jgi:serine protease Do
MKPNKILRFLGAGLLIATLSVGGGLLGSRLTNTNNSQTVTIGAQETPSFPVSYADGTDSDITHEFQNRFRQVAGATLPVVVEINVATRVAQQVQANPFDFFFGRPNQQQPEEAPERLQRGMGSGVIVGHNGMTAYVLTNDHVAGDADEIEIVLYDGREFKGELVGTDPLMDIALLSFQTAEDLPVAALGSSSTLQPGDWVFAVGNPLGFESTVTAGIVSATARQAQSANMSGVTDYIQTDAAINRGNSGGALVNIDGEVVGINTWIASQTGGSIGLGFAIPIDNAKRAIADIIETGEVAYSWLGVTVGTVTDAMAETMGFEATSGAFVSGVYEGSPAEQSGLRPGDVITRIGETEIEDSATLVQTVASITPGDETEFALVRAGREMSLMVTTGRRSQESFQTATLWPGLSVLPITDEARDQLSLDRGTDGVIVAQVTPQSAAAQSGVRPGDTIISVNGRGVDSPATFYEQLGNANGDEIRFRVIREGRTLLLGFVRSAA